MRATAFAVLWRDPDTGKQTSLTYDDRRQATVARRLIEAAGGREIEAARLAVAVAQSGPILTEVVHEHIDLLTGRTTTYFTTGTRNDASCVNSAWYGLPCKVKAADVLAGGSLP